MKKYTFTVFILAFSLLSVNAQAQIKGSDKKEPGLYREALALFNHPDPTPDTDSLALHKFLEVTRTTRSEQKNALVLFNSYEKAGILSQTNGYQRQAIALYKSAIACSFTYNLPDSLLFKPYLYCGSACFSLNLYDSALDNLKKAEAILIKFPVNQEAHRLYNTFGVLYYESGNYPQSINYFQKAVQLNVQNRRSDKTSLDYSYKSNIASALRKMGQYKPAVSMYKSLIPLNINSNELFINLGTIYLEKSRPDSALHYFLKVDNVKGNNRVILENALGNTYLKKNRPKEASVHLRNALALSKKEQQQRGLLRKSKQVGITYKLLGDIACRQHIMLTALRHYQQSIIQLDYSFNDPDIYHNPPTVEGGFRNYALFESLAAKANCMRELYEAQPTEKNRLNTKDTYQATLRLADYIEKSFDMEDARLFIIQKVFPVYQEAVTFMVRSYEQTKEEAYLEEAFGLAEKSKAVALYINLKENEFKSSANIPDSLLKKERELKFNLSRLLIKIDKSATSQELSALTNEMRENELALSRLANKLLDYPDYRRKKFSLDSIDVPYLRKTLLRQNRAIVSYFHADKVVYCFVLTPDGIQYATSPRDNAYRMALNNLNEQLRDATPGLRYQGHANARFLYSRLIEPVEQALRGVSSLLIIPHNELSLLPFDILEDKNETYLLEKFDVTYQYAASFLQDREAGTINFEQMLSMAPFDSSGQGSNPEFARLPASNTEITALNGVKLRNGEATKANFLKFSEDASAIHLATHAVPNNDDPSRSYIAFFANRQEESRLYAHELRNAPLSTVQLIFLSACETASGKLISGEGVMSLSRAFSAAGCSNIITSLWKAEDNATSYISVRFYEYLQEGYSYPQALQKAKLALLHDGKYAQFHSPQYWSHLVFVGIPDKSTPAVASWVWLCCALLTGLVTLVWWRYKTARKPVAQANNRTGQPFSL